MGCNRAASRWRPRRRRPPSQAPPDAVGSCVVVDPFGHASCSADGHIGVWLEDCAEVSGDETSRSGPGIREGRENERAKEQNYKFSKKGTIKQIIRSEKRTEDRKKKRSEKRKENRGLYRRGSEKTEGLEADKAQEPAAAERIKNNKKHWTNLNKHRKNGGGG